MRTIIGPIFSRIFDLTIIGAEHLPADGPAIIAANHTSVIDSFIVPAVLPRNISYVGKAEYLDDWKTKHIFPALGMIASSSPSSASSTWPRCDTSRR